MQAGLHSSKKQKSTKKQIKKIVFFLYHVSKKILDISCCKRRCSHSNEKLNLFGMCRIECFSIWRPHSLFGVEKPSNNCSVNLHKGPYCVCLMATKELIYGVLCPKTRYDYEKCHSEGVQKFQPPWVL